MSDLINREDAIEILSERAESLRGMQGDLGGACRGAMRIIESLPSAEPERKTGKWKKIGHWGRHYRCDQCGNTLDFDGVNVGRGDANFCPNCGARLERE